MTCFSIITPCYKGQQYIDGLVQMACDNAACLKNAQIDAELELILVNDSPEQPLDVPEEITGLRVIHIEHQQNGGIHQARITGLRAASGAFVLFLDQDDLITKDCLLKEYQIIRRDSADVVIANGYCENADGTRSKIYPTKGKFKNALDMNLYVKAYNQIRSPGHCLIRRSSIPDAWMEHVIHINGSDDLFLWILMMAQDRKFVACEDCVYVHRHTGSNLSEEGAKMTVSSLEVGEHLQKVSFVAPQIAAELLRSRKMSSDIRSVDTVRKLEILLRHMDIIFQRAWWKVRGMF